MEDKEKRRKDENSSNNDRVTLKKEIGLLSACAIIIGEYDSYCTSEAGRHAAIQLQGKVEEETWMNELNHCNVAGVQ